MRNKSKNIISGVSIVMAVLITAIIVILISVLSKNGKDEGAITQVKDSKNQVESTLDSTLDANISTSKADETIAANGDENGSSLIDNRNPDNNTQSNSPNNTQVSKQTTAQATTQTTAQATTQIAPQTTTSKTTSAYNPSVNTTTAKENTTGNRKSFKCYIGIYCKTILNNMDNLKSSKNSMYQQMELFLKSWRLQYMKMKQFLMF